MGKIGINRKNIERVYMGGIIGEGFLELMKGRIMNEVEFKYGWK